MDPLQRVERFAREERMFRRVSRVLAGVSGGADSVAALLLLLRLGERLSFEVIAGHFDHLLREDSKADLEFVRELCDRLDVRCITGEGDVRSLATHERMGIEEAARRARYEFLAFAAGKESCDAVATGHTADDQAETVLQHLVRGSGVRGVRGMLPVAPVPGAASMRLVRPLLVLRRAETVAICRDAGVDFREDVTNLDVSYRRNRIRREVLPLLRELNPSVDEALVGLAASAREVFGAVEAAADETQPLSRGPDGVIFGLEMLEDLPAEAITLVLEREGSFLKLVPEVNRTRLANLRQVLERGSGRVSFGDVDVEVSCGAVRVGEPGAAAEAFGETIVNVPGTTMAGPWRIDVSTDPLPGVAPVEQVVIDGARLNGVLRARPVRPGDRVRRGRLSKKVSDLLVDEKVPIWERRRLVAFADRDGIVALAGSERLPSRHVPPESALYVRVSRR
ncbi:MAG: tRNA lysidine(34) synthetase TilS [Dehalococcoidia bacterium]